MYRLDCYGRGARIKVPECNNPSALFTEAIDRGGCRKYLHSVLQVANNKRHVFGRRIPIFSTRYIGPGLRPLTVAAIAAIAAIGLAGCGNGEHASEAAVDTPETRTKALPQAPTNLRTVRVSEGTVALEWTDNSSNEDMFRVQWRFENANSWFESPYLSANSTSYTIPEIAAGRFVIRVFAHNANGPAISDGLNVVVPSARDQSPGSLRFIRSSSRSASLAWADNASNEALYRVQWRSPSQTTSWNESPILPADTVSWSADGLTPDTPYVFRVYALIDGVPRFSENLTMNPYGVNPPSLAMSPYGVNSPSLVIDDMKLPASANARANNEAAVIFTGEYQQALALGEMLRANLNLSRNPAAAINNVTSWCWAFMAPDNASTSTAVQVRFHDVAVLQASTNQWVQISSGRPSGGRGNRSGVVYPYLEGGERVIDADVVEVRPGAAPRPDLTSHELWAPGAGGPNLPFPFSDVRAVHATCQMRLVDVQTGGPVDLNTAKYSGQVGFDFWERTSRNAVAGVDRFWGPNGRMKALTNQWQSLNVITLAPDPSRIAFSSLPPEFGRGYFTTQNPYLNGSFVLSESQIFANPPLLR